MSLESYFDKRYNYKYARRSNDHDHEPSLARTSTKDNVSLKKLLSLGDGRDSSDSGGDVLPKEVLFAVGAVSILHSTAQ